MDKGRSNDDGGLPGCAKVLSRTEENPKPLLEALCSTSVVGEDWDTPALWRRYTHLDPRLTLKSSSGWAAPCDIHASGPVISQPTRPIRLTASSPSSTGFTSLARAHTYHTYVRRVSPFQSHVNETGPTCGELVYLSDWWRKPRMEGPGRRWDWLKARRSMAAAVQTDENWIQAGATGWWLDGEWRRSGPVFTKDPMTKSSP